MNERRDRIDHHQHHGGKRINPKGPIDRKITRCKPVAEHQRFAALAEAGLDEHDPRHHGRRHQQPRGDEFARAWANHAAKQPRNEKA